MVTKRRILSLKAVDESLPSISDWTNDVWRQRFVSNGSSRPSIAMNSWIRRLKIIFVYLKTVLRDEEHVRDQSSNTLSILHQIACRLFESVLDSFPLQLNAWNQTLIEQEGRNHILNSTFIFKNSEWKALHPAINWIISKATLG